MAYTPQNYFPMGYQIPQYPFQQQAPTTQSRMVEVVPVDNVAAAESFPVPVGATQILMAKDDSFVVIKVNGVNGQSSFDVYDRRPPAPPAPAFDPALYVTREELETRLSGLASRNKKEEKA